MVEGKSSQMTQGHEHSPCDTVILMIYIDIYRYRYWSSSLVIGTASKTLGISWIGLRKVSFVIYNNTWGRIGLLAPVLAFQEKVSTSY